MRDFFDDEGNVLAILWIAIAIGFVYMSYNDGYYDALMSTTY